MSYDARTGGTGAASGAASGAMMGSVIPGIGTAVGAVVGGIGGGSLGFLGGQPEAPKPMGPGKVLTLGLFQILLQQFEKLALAPPQANVNTESLARANKKLDKLESQQLDPRFPHLVEAFPMLFLKNPLKREFSPADIHRIREGSPFAGDAFLGVSLVTKTPCHVAPEKSVFTLVSGSAETQTVDIVISILREVVDKKSILLVNLTGIEENWHRFWAMCFNYDRARDFCLLDFANEERSDYTGDSLTVPVDHPYLFKKEFPAQVRSLLTEKKGFVAIQAGESQSETHVNEVWRLAQNWLSVPDFLVVFGSDLVKEMPINQGPNQRTILVQSGFSQAQKSEAKTQIMFRQRNPLPSTVRNWMENLAAGTSLAKVLKNLSADLRELAPNQCFVIRPEAADGKVDLIQITSGDGLPWPPEYRPLRSRHPGT